MDYSAALRKNLGASPPTYKATHVPVQAPPSPIPTQAQEVVDVAVDDEVNGDDAPEFVQEEVTGAGYFDWILTEDTLNETNLKVFVDFVGPSGLCLLARTCRYLFRAVFTSSKPLWSLLSPLPEPSEVFVKFYIDISPVEEGQKENISSVPLSQVKSEYQKNQLVKFWLRTVSNAHAAREKQLEQKKNDDPLVADKIPLKAVLRGGFSFYSGKTDKPLAKVNDLSHVYKWLEGINILLKSFEKPVTVPSDEGTVSLVRVGRGGHLISVSLKGERDLFDFGTFSEEVRKTAKDYFKIVGSCRSKLKKPQQVTQPAAFTEIESFINGVMSHDKLNQVLSNIKSALTHGAIPHSTLPEYFKRKRNEKALKNQQATSENGSIVNFLLSNLPPSIEDTKRARDVLERKIKTEIENEFVERQAAREERIQKERAARREALDNERLKKEGKKPKEKEVDWEVKEKKAAYKVVKEKGADGFETKVKVDDTGNKIKETKVVEKTTETEKKVKVKVPESVSASVNPFKPALLAGDSGTEIKEPKPAPAPGSKKAQPQPQLTQQSKKKPEEKKEKENKPPQVEHKQEEPKGDKKKSSTEKEKPKEKETKTEQPKTNEKKKTEKTEKAEVKPQKGKAKAKAESDDYDETATATINTTIKSKPEQLKTKEPKETKKKQKAEQNHRGKKPKSEEDEASGKVKPPKTLSLLEAPWVTPTLAVFLLVLAIAALYTLFLS